MILISKTFEYPILKIKNPYKYFLYTLFSTMLIMVVGLDYVCTSAKHLEADAMAHAVKIPICSKLRSLSPLRNIMVLYGRPLL
jgi:hypothetical protein